MVYQKYYMEHPEPEEEFEDERLRGYAARKDIHMLKVAMILSLADNDSLMLTPKEIKGAIDAIKWMESGLGRIFAGHGSAASSQDVVRVFQQVEAAMKKGFITHQELVKRNYAHLSEPELGVVLRTLRMAGAIEEAPVIDPTSKQTIYHYRVVDKGFIKQVRQSLPKSMKEDN